MSIKSVCSLLLTAGIFLLALSWQTDPATSNATSMPTLQPKFWKGNLHTHSLWSDGDDFPEMIAEWYKSKKYDFLAMTEHNILAYGEKWIEIPEKGAKRIAWEKYRKRFPSFWIESKTEKDKLKVRLKPWGEYRTLVEEPGKFLTIPAEEITHRYAKAPVHINAINLQQVITPTDGGNVGETIRVNLGAVKDQEKRLGGKIIAFLNHPNFGWGVRAEDMLMADDLRYFEVYNGHPGVRNEGDAQHASCERLWDIVLSLRLGKYQLPLIYGLATDDSHGYHEWGLGKVNPGRGWVMVRSAYLTPEGIVQGLRNGDFYGSTGVELIDFSFQNNELKLQIKPEDGVTYKTEFIATMKDASLDSVPVKDAEGKELPVTRLYSDEVGKVVATVEGTNPSFTCTGKEMYIRARVISSKSHPNPYRKGDVETAFTQPFVPTK